MRPEAPMSTGSLGMHSHRPRARWRGAALLVLLGAALLFLGIAALRALF